MVDTHARRSAVARRVERVAGWTTLVIASTVLVGGLAGKVWPTRWGWDLSRSTPFAAIFLVLLGLAHAVGIRSGLGRFVAAIASSLVLSGLVSRWAGWTHPIGGWPEIPDRSALPSYTTLVMFALLALASIAASASLRRTAQALAAVPLLFAVVVCTALAYGDRLALIEATTLRNIVTPAPDAVSIVLLVVAIGAVTVDAGVAAWLAGDGPGRRTFRRAVPTGVILIVFAAGIGRWAGLDQTMGVARTWALVVVAICIGIVAIGVAASDLIDRLATGERNVEIAELRFLDADRAAKLADLSRRLATAATTDEVANVVNRSVVVPFGASAASIGLVDRRAGVLRIVHGSTVPMEVQRRFQDPPLAQSLAFTDAARTGEPVVLGSYEEYLDRYPDADPSISSLGWGARAAMPLRDREGATFGAVIVAWSTAVDFEAPTISTLETVAELVAQTLERTRLSDTVAADADRNSELARVAEALGTAVHVQQVADVLGARLPSAIGAHYTTVGTVDHRAGVLRRYLPGVADGADVEELALESIDARRPLVDAARRGETVLVLDSEQLAREYPDVADFFAELGFVAVANVPLRDGTGGVVGALGVAWNDPDEMTPARLSTLTTIAQMTGQTLERVRLAQAEHRLVSSLQERILQPLAPVPGYDVAARYRSAAAELGMGGDWFEGIALDDGARMAVVVGDVVGHGIEAIADMSYLRSTLAALFRTGVPLEELFTAAGDAVDPVQVTATALAAVLRADGDEVELLSAGHPPPILVTASGETTVLEEGRQPLIGVRPIRPVSTLRLTMEPGSVLALYTDGLVEERRASIDEGIAHAAALVRETRELSAAEQADAILAARVAEGHSQDDIALVIIKRLA